MLKKIILKNKTRIITIPLKNTEAVTFLVLVGAGSKYETKDISGISHFLEHMFFKGTKKRPTTLAIAETLDKVGGEFNAFTGKEYTGFWAKVAKQHKDTALDFISDLFLNAKIEAEAVEREKGVIIEEINLYLDTPTSYIGDLWEKLLYGDQPAGWSIAGEKETVSAINREKIVKYLQDHYSSQNTIICVAGDINEKEIAGKIEKAFEKINPKPASEKVKVIEKQSKPEALVYFKKTDQTHLCLGVRAYNMFSPQKYALTLLAIILGGNMSSRLFTSVREKRGLAYYIRTVAETSSDTGYLATVAGIDNKNVGEVVKLILQEYQSLKNNLINEEELQKAKDYFKGTLSLSLESSDSQASFYAEQELLKGEMLEPQDVFKKIDKVSINDIKKVAEDIFKPDKLNLALIGPFEEKKEFEKLLII